ncbi:MAG: CHAD domain-containing protein [Bacteroidetes bacterium]|nr:CHAD domain-containing protein [Bacteroidota bacterium]
MSGENVISDLIPRPEDGPGDGRKMKKTLQGLLGSGEAMIPAGGFPGPEQVHDIRVNMKKARAILKLLKGSAGNAWYTRENSEMRDISALFSSSREADVVTKTIRLLSRKDPEVFNAEVVMWLKSAASTAIAGNSSEEVGNRVAAEAADRLRRAWYRVCFVNLSTVDEEHLLDGLWESFLRAEVAFGKARVTHYHEHIHEMRKRVKDLLYQTGFFSRYNPEHFSKLYSELDEIASVLGKCNDISVLWSMVADQARQLADKEYLTLERTFAAVRTAMFSGIEQRTLILFRTFYTARS